MPASLIPVTGLTPGPVGAVSQTDFPLTSARQLRATDTLFANFGDPVVLNSDNTYSTVATFVANGGTLTATTPLGVAQENTKTNVYYPLNGGTAMSAGQYAPGNIMDVLTRGTINVAINNGGSVAANTPVFVRVSVNAAVPAGVVGGFETVADGAHSVQVPNMVIRTGLVTSDNTAQLTLLNRLIA